MKIIILFFTSITMSFNSFASEEYSDMAYTGAVFMYWCTYHEIPRNLDDLAKVTDLNDKNPKLTLSIDKWLQTLRFKVVGEKLQVLRKTRRSGVVTTVKSISNCESIEVIMPQSNRDRELLK
jgi:hypothetical protein